LRLVLIFRRINQRDVSVFFSSSSVLVCLT
jgi:hypothetical protein